MIIRRRKTPKHPRRRMDLSVMRDVLADGKVWCGIALVGNEDIDSNYFELDGEDLLVDVLLMPTEEPLTARMGAYGAGPNAGIWTVPPRGAEVAIVFPEGDFAGGPIIVGILSTGNVPDGVAANTIVIASGEVLVHDGDGGAAALATKADIDALESWATGHSHTWVGTGSGQTTVPSDPTPYTPVVADPAPSASGTSILKGK